MKRHESMIWRHFRAYRVREDEMLFFNATASNPHSQQFHQAMTSLMDRGLVFKETPKDAYSLTSLGFEWLQNRTEDKSRWDVE